MNPKLRAAALLVALGATLAAVRWARNLDGGEGTADTIVQAREVDQTRRAAADARSEDSVRAASARGGLDLQRLQRSPGVDPNADPFAMRDFRPRPPAVNRPIAQAAVELPPPPPPPPPQAPPLPFSYLGKLAEGDDTMVFLAMGDRNLVVKPGDVIDNSYRLEEVSDTHVVLTYLPLTVKQTLPIGAK
jgi:hypothetical protein